ncbi:DmsC/YnfH family molybdoenzyme membrane anchor subunit, partial [Amaricoccus sp.]|uniref:DmsC/YnfH family molybdoenzyme membrane anchor subunit n=1 Tax=Amaricoccus sp. TaxID=1872485 RepID=UPI00262EDA22
MHPTPSIIAFTTLSGLGFGLMAWLGVGDAAVGQLHALAISTLAAGLAAAGLLASLLHLGQPRRFLKAFSQWRSSWLSREAILAVATLLLFTLFAAVWGLLGIRSRWIGVPAGAAAMATVVATSMIYAQLRSVPRWRSPLTPLLFLLPALAGGGLLAGEARPAAWLLAAFGLVQVASWIRGDGSLARSGTTIATATGLGALGRVRLFAPPHT